MLRPEPNDEVLRPEPNDELLRPEPNDEVLRLGLLTVGVLCELRGEVMIWSRLLLVLLPGVKVLRGEVLLVPRPEPNDELGVVVVVGRVTVLRVLLSRRPKLKPVPLPLVEAPVPRPEPNEMLPLPLGVLLPPRPEPKVVPLLVCGRLLVAGALLGREPSWVLGREPNCVLGLPIMGGRRAVPNDVALFGLPWKPLP